MCCLPWGVCDCYDVCCILCCVVWVFRVMWVMHDVVFVCVTYGVCGLCVVCIVGVVSVVMYIDCV